MCRRFTALFGAGALLGALLILVFAIGSASPTHAADIATIAIDTDTTGNTVTPCAAYPCNDSTTLGTIDACRAINVGDSIQIDVVGISLPDGGASGSYTGAGLSDMDLNWTPSGAAGPIEVEAYDFSVALVHQAVPGNNTSGGSDSPPDNDGDWHWDDTDVNTDQVGEGGQGIAARITIKGINAGTATLSLAINTLSQPTWTDVNGNEYSIGTNNGATIIVGGGTCEGITQTPTPSPTPSPSPTPCTGTACPSESVTPSPSPTPTPTASPTGTSRTWGDGDCSGAVSPVDSLKTLKTDAGLAPAQTVAGCPAWGSNVTVNGITVKWGDVDCSGSVSPVDSLKVLKTDAGLPPAQTVANCPAMGSMVLVS